MKSRPAVGQGSVGFLSPNGLTYVTNKVVKDPANGQFALRSSLQDLETGRETIVMFDPKNQARPIGFAGNDRLVLIESATQKYRVWELATGKLNEAISMPIPRFGGRFAVSADGRTIAIAGLTNDRKSWQIRVWNLGSDGC